MRTGEPDAETLCRARSGDERAFAVVVDHCGGLVLNLAWRMVRDRHEAEDLAQEVFVRLFRFFDRYDPARPFLPWLRRMTTNLLINLCSLRWRRDARATGSLDAAREATGALPPDSGAEEAADRVVFRERAGRIRAAVAGLRPEYRAVLALFYFEGRSYEELARDLDLPLGTVKNRLFRAREELAGVLEEQRDEL